MAECFETGFEIWTIVFFSGGHVLVDAGGINPGIDQRVELEIGALASVRF